MLFIIDVFEFRRENVQPASRSNFLSFSLPSFQVAGFADVCLCCVSTLCHGSTVEFLLIVQVRSDSSQVNESVREYGISDKSA